MAFKNEISIQFSSAELQSLDKALSTIEQVVTGKVINLHPDERSAHARLGDKTEAYVSKSRSYMTQYPGWVDADRINLAEMDKDIAARASIAPRLNRALAIFTGFDDSQLLLGSDIFDSCKAFYNIVKGKAESDVPGAKAVYEDLKQRFPGRPKRQKATVIGTAPVSN